MRRGFSAWLAARRKSITAIAVSLIGWGTVVVTSDAVKITASEWLAFVVAWATSLGVYAVPNTPADGDDEDAPPQP